MNRDDIIRMAREAGSIDSEEVIENVWNAFSAAQREADAKRIEEYPYWLGTVAKQEIAAAIRARGNK